MIHGERIFVIVKNNLSAIGFNLRKILAKLGLCLSVVVYLSVKTVNFKGLFGKLSQTQNYTF